MFEKYSRIYRRYRKNQQIKKSHLCYFDTWFQGYFRQKARFMKVLSGKIYFSTGRARFSIERTLYKQEEKQFKKILKCISE